MCEQPIFHTYHINGEDDYLNAFPDATVYTYYEEKELDSWEADEYWYDDEYEDYEPSCEWPW